MSSSCRAQHSNTVELLNPFAGAGVTHNLSHVSGMVQRRSATEGKRNNEVATQGPRLAQRRPPTRMVPSQQALQSRAELRSHDCADTVGAAPNNGLVHPAWKVASPCATTAGRGSASRASRLSCRQMARRRPGASGTAATAAAMRCSLIWPSPAAWQGGAGRVGGAPVGSAGSNWAATSTLQTQFANRAAPPLSLTIKPDAGLRLHRAHGVAGRQAQADPKLDLGIQVDKGQRQAAICRQAG